MKSPELDTLTTYAGVVTGLRRYPVKSMQGETTDSATITASGILGDRTFALIDIETGKVVSAKNPRKWPGLFGYSASFVTPPGNGSVPTVRITLPGGATVTSDQHEAGEILSKALGRAVTISSSAPEKATLEEYWPDIAELPHQDAITDEGLPAGTFFDCALVHVLTTATLERFAELYPEGKWDVRRFRPNVVVDAGSDAGGFVENSWVGRMLRIGSAVLRVTGGTPRCAMTTLAQDDLPHDNNILRTAAQKNDAYVGVYASVVSAGIVRCGDTVALT